MNDLFSQSRELFEKYATFDGNTGEIRADGHPLHATQIDLARWHVRNFGAIQAHEMALGICEEACFELNVAYVACNRVKEYDARCDALVFATQLLTALRLSVEPLILDIEESSSSNRMESANISAGRIAQHVLKRGRKIRECGNGTEEEFRRQICSDVHNLTRSLFVRIYTLTDAAVDVLARDWKANPLTGRV